jgi:hypothetical protein
MSIRQYSRLLPNFRFRFRFRLCANFRGGSVFRDPPCTRTRTGIGTSPNHFASLHGATSAVGHPLLTAEQKQIRVLMAIELLQVLSVHAVSLANSVFHADWKHKGRQLAKYI